MGERKPWGTAAMSRCSATVGVRLGAALVSEVIAASPREPAVGEGLLAGLDERDELDVAHPGFVLPAPERRGAGSSFDTGSLDVGERPLPLSAKV